MEERLNNNGPKAMSTNKNETKVVAWLQINLLSNRQVAINTDRTDPVEMLALLQNAQASLVQQIIQAHGKKSSSIVVARAME
jgi:hypothetical protein